MSAPEVSLTTRMAEALPGTDVSARLSQARGQIVSIPFRVSIAVALASWKVQDLNTLSVGSLILSGVAAGNDVPVCVGGALLGYAELDNVDDRMAIRLTRLS